MLKWLTLSLFAYVATVFMVTGALGRGAARPGRSQVAWSTDYLTTLVAMLGTTISPYLFFWQARRRSRTRASGPRDSS